jgi:hypothetical protein
MGLGGSEVDFWHRDIPGTGWTRGLGAVFGPGLLIFTGIADLVIDCFAIGKHFFASSAAWMGVGSWFQWVLAAQMALAGISALYCGWKWLKTRKKDLIAIGGYCGAIGIFLGPTHQPSESSEIGISWFRYGLSVFMLALGIFAIVMNHREEGKRSHEDRSAID